MTRPVADRRELVRAFAGRRMVVIGNLMLDAYLVGETRASHRRRPCPWSRSPNQRTARRRGQHGVEPGGAGGFATVVGVLGDDAEGERLRALLGQAGIATEFIIRDQTRPTTSKTRIIARGQQIVRIDSEVRAPLAPPQELALMGALREALSQADGCVLSDYHKGVLTPRVSAEAVSLGADRIVRWWSIPRGPIFRATAAARW